MKKRLNQLFTAAVVLMLAVPLAFTAIMPTTASTEKRELASAPKLFDESGFNFEFLQNAGSWFEDHFAFRSQMVNACADLEEAIFDESSAQKVIMGKDGWLFYQETMDDYLGLNPISEREMFNIVHNLELIRYGVESRGSSLMIMIVPNKNTIYSRYMKDRYIQAEQSTLSRFNQAMEKAHLPYVDLADAFLKTEDQIYYRQDTHWNSTGALLGYNELMNALGLEHDDFSHASFKTEKIHRSDLAEILYPQSDELEEDNVYSPDYHVINDAADNMADWIETSGSGDSSILMYRDSFGESLIPFVASQFDQGWFTRLVPYNLLQVEQLKPEWVVIERAERRIRSFQESACIMNMPVVRLGTVENESADAGEIKYEKDNDFVLFSGKADLKSEQDELYLEVKSQDGTVYQYPVFYIDEGFQVYLPVSLFKGKTDVSLIRKSGTELSRIAKLNMEEL